MAEKEKRQPHPEPDECEPNLPTEEPTEEGQPVRKGKDDPHPKSEPQKAPSERKPSCPDGYPR